MTPGRLRDCVRRRRSYLWAAQTAQRSVHQLPTGSGGSYATVPQDIQKRIRLLQKPGEASPAAMGYQGGVVIGHGGCYEKVLMRDSRRTNGTERSPEP
jgi:hypothetical protein